MGKASSSRKKERSKTSSSQRSRRKSKSSRKLKSKKQRYRHDSPSCSDTDFESSTSVPSSSSEDDKKVRRSRSKTRKNVKPSKKRFKKQSHDRQSRECSPNPRKRKHSKRNDRREVNKANKKKRRRDVSVGHSDSLSCSTCGNGTTTSNESEVVRRRGRFAKRKGNMRKTGSGRYMSKSRSPCSLHSEGSDYQNEVDDDSYVEKNFRRLRSIIVVVGEENKLKTFVGNEQQEEVTNQLSDDHPSSGEMDSKDATGKRGLDYVVTKEALVVENEKEVDVPNYRNSMVVKDGGVQNEGSNKNHGGVTNDHSSDEIKNGCSDNTDSINCIDLESMLRQRALENLRKFKGASPRNVETIANCKVDHNNAAKQLRSPVSDSVHVTSPKNNAEINSKRFSRQGGGNAINSMILKENGVKSMDAIDSAVATMHDPVYSSQNLALRPEPKVDSLIKQTSAAQESVQTKPSISDVGVGETAQTQTQMRNNDDLNIRNGLGSSAYEPSSSLNSISGEDSLNMSNQESGESSQFEQKTMSVMRGGEMVQVNYKVYIPKRAPALTRRQLKR
ncbi:hypothetical protein IC582_015727 [Cucumis melo]|uniref:Uncharacterized protein LOC103501777 isoform X2 n=1 Tax=Cucumis melo TaxID=3656 RepID=A0ABM3L1M2_CUCME|nr:uncharacterized protein LOC103501777 isoform X2 [Cucumis melo]